MPRRNKKKQRRQSRDYAQVASNGIEKDLREQRLRQQKRAQDAEKAKTPKVCPPPEKEQKSQNPLPHRNVLVRHLIHRGVASHQDVASVQSHALASAYETLASSLRQRTKIRQLWHGRYLLESMQSFPRASGFYHSSRWRDYQVPDGLYCDWDLTCKFHLHPSARTFDVAMADETTQLPHIATAVQGGLLLLQHSLERSSHHRANCLRREPVHVVRMHETSGRLGTVTHISGSSQPQKFHCQDMVDGRNIITEHLSEPVHDLCFGTDLVLFAPSKPSRGSIAPLFLPLHMNGTLRSLQVDNFPQSDALRIEVACESNFVAFGHRNGLVSLLDLRHSTSCIGTMQHEEEGADSLGSASDFKFISPTQLLVKRSFGSSQLHDMRRIGGSNKKNASLIHSMSVPSEEIQPTLSSRCNGLAVDPTSNQVLFTPYINSKHESALGIWSLHTGMFLGSKILLSNPTRDMIYTEVCQKTTPAWKSGRHRDPSSFGVWLKSGRFSSTPINSKYGSLHHITLPGSWK